MHRQTVSRKTLIHERYALPVTQEVVGSSPISVANSKP